MYSSSSALGSGFRVSDEEEEGSQDQHVGFVFNGNGVIGLPAAMTDSSELDDELNSNRFTRGVNSVTG